MALAIGTRLGPYEVLTLLGAGGMGEVYRARDTKLSRDVALKILPDAFTLDGDRIARFHREAQVLAKLNHSNIAAIYGLEDSGSTHALVLELIEGPTLADRIAKGPIPLDEALPIAKQIADALEAAHEHGIIHRDLKPANIKLRDDETVKVLDFGLAKALEPRSAISPALTNSPTITTPAQLTGVGALLGTAAYMSPEQAKGRPADKRSDVWAFGCVLYEMLTGTRAFNGDNISDILASVLKEEPDWSSLPADTPAPIRRLLRRSLQKDRHERLPDIGGARMDIADVLDGDEPTETAPAPFVRRWFPWGLAATLAAALAFSVWFYPPVPQDQQAIRFAVETPELLTPSMLAVSPNGRYLVFSARTSPLSATYSLYLRSMDVIKTQLLPDTEGGTFPFWSPDSRHIGFFADGKIKRLDVSGGPPRTVCVAPMAIGGAWNRDDVIVFGSLPGPLKRVSASGGEPRDLTSLNGSEGIHGFPVFLPNGRQFLYVAAPLSVTSVSLIVGSLDSKQRIVVLQTPSNFLYAAPGYLLFRRDRTLLAQRFNAERLALDGDPISIAEDLGGEANGLSLAPGTFGVSDTGVLAYQTGLGGEQSELAWYTRAGKPLGLLGLPGDYHGIALSPDDKRVAVHLHDPSHGGGIWVRDIDRGSFTRLTTDPSHNFSPLWTRDGTAVAFASERDNASGIYQQSADSAGSDAMQLLRSDLAYPEDYSPNGPYLSYFQGGPGGTTINVLPLTDARKPQPFTNNTGFLEGLSKFSPDGNWIAYTSNEQKRNEVYVQQYPQRSKKVLISTNGGQYPRWSRNGNELFYMTEDGTIMAVDVREDATSIEPSAPRMLFKTTAVLTGHVGLHYPYDVTRDGQRFLIDERPTPVNRVAPLTVVLNWSALLKK